MVVRTRKLAGSTVKEIRIHCKAERYDIPAECKETKNILKILLYFSKMHTSIDFFNDLWSMALLVWWTPLAYACHQMHPCDKRKIESLPIPDILWYDAAQRPRTDSTQNLIF